MDGTRRRGGCTNISDYLLLTAVKYTFAAADNFSLAAVPQLGQPRAGHSTQPPGRAGRASVGTVGQASASDGSGSLLPERLRREASWWSTQLRSGAFFALSSPIGHGLLTGLKSP